MLESELKVEIPYFIFFPERSGSTFLVHLLNSHPDVHCEHELFFVRKRPDSNHLDPGLTLEKDKLEILKKIYQASGVKASGFKFKFSAQYEAYPDVYRYLLRNMDSIKVIFLYRKNLLKTAISRQNLKRLTQAGEKHFLKPEDNYDLAKIDLDLQQAKRYLNWSTRELDFFQRASKVFEHRIEVTYEDLVADTHSTLNNIFKFLGVDPLEQDVAAPTKKITDDNLPNAVANYDEMVEFFQTTRFSQFLEI